jgi:hypothetical protein
MHHHRTNEHSILGWSYCVVASDHYCDGAPHGGTVRTDTCRCGAQKVTESNGVHTASTGWFASCAAGRTARSG